jgi:hypothetical protein
LGVPGGGPLAHVVDQRQQRRIGEAVEDERTARLAAHEARLAQGAGEVKRSGIGQQETFAAPGYRRIERLEIYSGRRL